MGAAGGWEDNLSTWVVAMGPTADPRSNYAFVSLFIHSYWNFLCLSCNTGVIGMTYELRGLLGGLNGTRVWPLAKAWGVCYILLP